MCQAGGRITLLRAAALQAVGRPLSTARTQTLIYRHLPDDRKRTESTKGSLHTLNHLLCACMYVHILSGVCVCVCVCVNG